jgi:hypothetical protein
MMLSTRQKVPYVISINIICNYLFSLFPYLFITSILNILSVNSLIEEMQGSVFYHKQGNGENILYAARTINKFSTNYEIRLLQCLLVNSENHGLKLSHFLMLRHELYFLVIGMVLSKNV